MVTVEESKSKVPVKFTAYASVLPDPSETVEAFVSRVPPPVVAAVTVRFALTVPSQVVKLPAVIERLLAHVRAKDAPV
jgi:hypothetical protein